MVFIWLGLIFMPVIFLLMMSHSGPLDFNVFGQKVGEAQKWVFVLPAIGIYALLLWERWVLSRPEIKALFQRGA